MPHSLSQHVTCSQEALFILIQWYNCYRAKAFLSIPLTANPHCFHTCITLLYTACTKRSVVLFTHANHLGLNKVTSFICVRTGWSYHSNRLWPHPYLVNLLYIPLWKMFLMFFFCPGGWGDIAQFHRKSCDHFRSASLIVTHTFSLSSKGVAVLMINIHCSSVLLYKGQSGLSLWQNARKRSLCLSHESWSGAENGQLLNVKQLLLISCVIRFLLMCIN